MDQGLSLSKIKVVELSLFHMHPKLQDLNAIHHSLFLHSEEQFLHQKYWMGTNSQNYLPPQHIILNSLADWKSKAKLFEKYEYPDFLLQHLQPIGYLHKDKLFRYNLFQDEHPQ